VDYFLVQVCVVGVVLNRGKAFIDVVSGNGGVALLIGGTIEMHCVLLHGVSPGCKPYPVLDVRRRRIWHRALLGVAAFGAST
jgi:hypothetical protein